MRHKATIQINYNVIFSFLPINETIVFSYIQSISSIEHFDIR